MRCIYKITINERYYIGSASNLKERIRLHLLDLKRNTHINSILQRTYNKYGCDKFKYEVLEEVEREDNLFDVEQLYLDKFYEDDMCMNLAKIAGGGNLYERTPESIAKSLETRRSNGNWYPKVKRVPTEAIQSNTGSKRCQEFRDRCVGYMEKVRTNNPELFKEAAAKGRKNRWERDCKPFMLVKNDVEYGPYKTQAEAFNTGILSNVSISRLLQGKLESVKGFSVKHLDKYSNETVQTVDTNI